MVFDCQDDPNPSRLVPFKGELTGRPAELSACKDMRMAVEHRLLGVGAGIEHQPEVILGAFSLGHGANIGKQSCCGQGIGCSQAADIGFVKSWDHQQVSGRLRIDVAERHTVFGLGNDVSRDFSRDDLAKQATTAHLLADAHLNAPLIRPKTPL